MPSYLPKDHNAVCPYVHASDVEKLIEFLRATFDARELFRMAGPDGRIAHAEVRIADSIVMMGSPPKGQEMRAQIHCYVPDVDAAHTRALAAGAKSIRAPQDMFYGDRVAGVADVWGNQWFMATHEEDVSDEEMKRRAQAQKAT